MKSQIIVLLLLITTIVGCGQAPDNENDDNGGQNPAPELNDRDEDQDGDEGDNQDDKDEKDEKEDD